MECAQTNSHRLGQPLVEEANYPAAPPAALTRSAAMLLRLLRSLMNSRRLMGFTPRPITINLEQIPFDFTHSLRA
jgi:hypothetical protein